MDPKPVDTERERNQGEQGPAEATRARPTRVSTSAPTGSPLIGDVPRKRRAVNRRPSSPAEQGRRDAISEDAHLASQRALNALHRAIRATPFSQRQVERRAGFSRGYLSQLLAGNVDLKVRHILSVLDALGIAPGQFFASLYPRTGRAALSAFQNRHGQEAFTKADDLDAFHELGIESLAGLRQRLERCERVVAQLEGLGIVSQPSVAPLRPDP